MRVLHPVMITLRLIDLRLIYTLRVLLGFIAKWTSICCFLVKLVITLQLLKIYGVRLENICG
jgi:hypothetical protein